MGTFIDALLNKHSPQPARIDPATIAEPVPVSMIIQPPSDLTSTSDINQAAVGAWPTLIDAGAKFWNGGWRNSKLKEVTNRNLKGNYGSITSQVNYGFRWREFAGIASYPTPVPTPHRPMWNDLIPIVWGLRIPNPNTKTNTTAQKGPISIQTKPSTWQGSNTASLNDTGVTLL